MRGRIFSNVLLIWTAYLDEGLCVLIHTVAVYSFILACTCINPQGQQRREIRAFLVIFRACVQFPPLYAILDPQEYAAVFQGPNGHLISKVFLLIFVASFLFVSKDITTLSRFYVKYFLGL